MQPGDFDYAVKEMRKIDHVVKVSVIAGEYDIVVRVNVKDLRTLLRATEKIQAIKGVKRTTTQVIEKEITV